jgi:hypothetical protein
LHGKTAQLAAAALAQMPRKLLECGGAALLHVKTQGLVLHAGKAEVGWQCHLRVASCQEESFASPSW